MQRPLCCAQAPDIFAFGVFACFAAIAGEIDTAARAVAIAALTIHFMEGPLRSHSPKNLARIALSGQGAHGLGGMGKLKVFKHLNDWFEEFRLFHRKDGKVVEGDDLMAATRYGIMMLRFASTKAAYDKFRRPIEYPKVKYV
jgi:hypothetical protein